MLSERDRRTLATIDLHLTDDDPGLADCFRGWTVPGVRERRRWPLVLAVVLLCLAMLMSVLAGWPLVFWVATLTLSAVIGIRCARDRKR